MKIALTGHTSGIGNALYHMLETNNHTVTGFSRSTGYNLSNPLVIKRLVDNIDSYDTFINNAYVNQSQAVLFEKVLNKWFLDPSKTIVNINSRARYKPNDPRHYAIHKRDLYSLFVDAINNYNRKCKLININFGYVSTDRVKFLKENHPMLSTTEAAESIIWCLEQPQHIEVAELSIWAI